VLTSVYAESHGISITSSLSFSGPQLTGPLDGKTVTNICTMLIWDDGPAAGKIVIEGSLDIEDIVNIEKNNKSYWIIVVKPEQKCRVLGRCKFWLCPVTSSDIPSRDTYISGWSEWVWDAYRRQYGRY
jgi:hypothetical protein